MKAIEFVKKFGWDVARDLATREKTSIGYLSVEHHGLNQDELKNLVNAYELVEVGLPELKKEMFSESRDLDYVKKWVLAVSEKLLTEKGIKLKQAIELVESVNE